MNRHPGSLIQCLYANFASYRQSVTLDVRIAVLAGIRTWSRGEYAGSRVINFFRGGVV
jgi:hypothetical protein